MLQFRLSRTHTHTYTKLCFQSKLKPLIYVNWLYSILTLLFSYFFFFRKCYFFPKFRIDIFFTLFLVEPPALYITTIKSKLSMRIVFFFFSFLLVGHLGTSLLWWPPPNQYTNGLFSSLDFAPCYLQPLPRSDYVWHWWDCARRQVGYGRVPMPHPRKGDSWTAKPTLPWHPKPGGLPAPARENSDFPPGKPPLRDHTLLSSQVQVLINISM